MQIVALRGLQGVDAYRVLGVPYLATNVVFGLALAAAAFWVSKRYGERMDRSPVLRRVMRDLGGYNLAQASRFVTSISDFVQEPEESPKS